jgi:hypothetical protein
MWYSTMGWAMWLLMGLGTAGLWVVVFLLVRELLPGAGAPPPETGASVVPGSSEERP